MEEGASLGLFRPNLLKPESDPGVAEGPARRKSLYKLAKKSLSFRLHIFSKDAHNNENNFIVYKR